MLIPRLFVHLFKGRKIWVTLCVVGALDASTHPKPRRIHPMRVSSIARPESNSALTVRLDDEPGNGGFDRAHPHRAAL